jgi:hypothetical protein
VRHRGFATGATFSQHLDAKAAVEAIIAADGALPGGLEAGPGRLALALGFDLGSVAPAAAETVTVVTQITPTAPVGVEPLPGAWSGRILRATGAMPFRGALGYVLDLPVGGEVGVAVYDGRGRRVRRLIAGPLASGRRTLTWDGRDDRGVDTPAGLYFLRATTPAGEATLRAVRVR